MRFEGARRVTFGVLQVARFQRDVGEGDEGLRGAVLVAAAAAADAEAFEEGLFHRLVVAAEVVQLAEVVEPRGERQAGRRRCGYACAGEERRFSAADEGCASTRDRWSSAGAHHPADGQGLASITAETALQLEGVLGVPSFVLERP